MSCLQCTARKAFDSDKDFLFNGEHQAWQLFAYVMSIAAGSSLTVFSPRCMIRIQRCPHVPARSKHIFQERPMDFLELVRATRTCRRFHQAEGLPEGTLTWLTECARLASCAGNAQALRFALAETPEACSAVYPALKWAALFKDWDGPEEGERPTGYVVLAGEKGKRAALNSYDAGIAAQTMQLAAQTRGIGACMLLSFNHEEVARALDFPETMEPLLVVAFGMQKEERVADTATDGNLAYWRDEKGVHHVPKLPLDSLILVRK